MEFLIPREQRLNALGLRLPKLLLRLLERRSASVQIDRTRTNTREQKARKVMVRASTQSRICHVAACVRAQIGTRFGLVFCRSSVAPNGALAKLKGRYE